MVDMVVPAASGPREASQSAVTWPAIIAGGVTAAAISSILLLLGAGLGLKAISPWSNAGVSATTLGVGAIIWLIVTQWISAGLGGYLTGRLRTKWVSVHTHEVFFRDTAHGFLSWALGTVISAALLASAVSAVVGGATTATSTVLSGAVQGATQGAAQAAGTATSPIAYFVDMLFRSEKPAAPATTSGTAATAPGSATAPGPATASPASSGSQDIRGESERILVEGLSAGTISPEDKTYLAQLVASQTGLSQADAEKRVDDVFAQAKAAEEKVKQAADTARKTAATLALFSFLSLLIGAFIASVAAAFGGHQRDEFESLYPTE